MTRTIGPRRQPTFERRGVDFVHGEATRIDPGGQNVETTRGVHGYDYLVIATGYLNDLDVIPGLGPAGGERRRGRASLLR